MFHISVLKLIGDPTLEDTVKQNSVYLSESKDVRCRKEIIIMRNKSKRSYY